MRVVGHGAGTISMTDRAFIDTNIVVYAYDRSDPVKQEQARSVMADTDRRPVVSTQVLSEFYVTITRKLERPVPSAAAREAVDRLSRFPVIPLDRDLALAAIDTAQSHQLSYWDSLIVEAARVGGCRTLLTEDLNAGSEIRGVEIVNPFT